MAERETSNNMELAEKREASFFMTSSHFDRSAPCGGLLQSIT